MIWAVLIGNTRAVAALMEGRKTLARTVVPTSRLGSLEGTRKWASSLRRSSDAGGVQVASVVPGVDARVARSLRRSFTCEVAFLKPERPWPIRIKLKKPGQLGADRIANAVAAAELFGAPVIVVDYGTGTTFDVVDRKGAYLGGAILPGLGISLRALHDYTAKLPLVRFAAVRKAVGRTTEEAIRSGIYHGAVGTTRELLREIRKELGAPAPSVATGGWCGKFKRTGLFDHIEPDLTLIGLSILWRNTHEKP